MSTEALNRIIKEVGALTPQERRELIERLDAPSSFTHAEESTTNGTTLADWLNEARNMRAELPFTSDSVDILRGLREGRSTQ